MPRRKSGQGRGSNLTQEDRSRGGRNSSGSKGGQVGGRGKGRGSSNKKSSGGLLDNLFD